MKDRDKWKETETRNGAEGNIKKKKSTMNDPRVITKTFSTVKQVYHVVRESLKK